MSTTDMPFEGSGLTVKEILDYPNPILDLQQKGRASDTSANPMWPLVTLEDVEDWDDFTTPNINAAWGNIYNKTLSGKWHRLLQIHFENADSRLEDDRIIKDEEDFEKIGRKWHEEILKAALVETAPDVQQWLKTSSPGRVIIDWAPHRIPWVPHDKPVDLIMDWAIRFSSDKSRILVVGETKKSTVFNSALLRNYRSLNGNLKLAGTWPIRQVAAYAYQAGTRYGAIITPEELFLFEFFRKTDDVRLPHLGCRCKVIPMDGTDFESTANFALWAHGMYALHDDHRELVFKHDIIPLNVWTYQKDGESCLYTNIRSGRVITDPSQIPEGAHVVTEEGLPAVLSEQSGRPTLKKRQSRRKLGMPPE